MLLELLLMSLHVVDGRLVALNGCSQMNIFVVDCRCSGVCGSYLFYELSKRFVDTLNIVDATLNEAARPL